MQIEINERPASLIVERAKKTHTTPDSLASDIIFRYFVSDDYVEALVRDLFKFIPSVRSVYLSGSNTITTIMTDDDPADRCKVYDAEQSIDSIIPSRHFAFFTATNEANYSLYKKIYERIEP